MGLFKLMGKAVSATAKLAGTGIKAVGKEVGKEIGKGTKNVGKEITKETKKKVNEFFESKVAEIGKNKEPYNEYVNSNKNEPILLEKKEEKIKTPSISYIDQINVLKELNELLKAGVLTQEEFDIKKKEILNI